MPVTDDSLWPNGSLIVVSLSEVGHTVATMLKKKDKLKRKGNIYLRGNRLSTFLKKESTIDGYKSIFLVLDVAEDYERFKNSGNRFPPHSSDHHSNFA